MKKTVLMFLLVFSCIVNAQTAGIKFAGTVVDNTGQPIPGVTVTSDAKSTVTDFDGGFTIIVANTKSVVSFSYLGFTTKSITVGKSTTMKVMLEEAKNVQV